MNIGHRAFVVQGGAITAISQKLLNDFYHRRTAHLPQHAGQTIDIAVAYYWVERRRPKQVTRMDCIRLKVASDGTLDVDHRSAMLRLAANRGGVNGADVSAADDAAWRTFNPELSEPARAAILKSLFG